MCWVHLQSSGRIWVYSSFRFLAGPLQSLLCVSAITQSSGVGTELGHFQVSPEWTCRLQAGQRCVVNLSSTPPPAQTHTHLVVSCIQNPHFKFLNIGQFQKSWTVTCVVEVTKLANIQKDSLFIICDACIVNQWQKDLPERMLYKINHSKREKAACFSAIIHQAWPYFNAKYHFSSRASSVLY